MAWKDKNLSNSDIIVPEGASRFAGRILRYARHDEPGGAYAWTLFSGSLCGFSRQRTNFPHLHSNGYEICLVLEGSGLYRHGDKSYEIGVGDLFLADPGAIHEISSHEAGDLLLAFFLLFVAEPTSPWRRRHPIAAWQASLKDTPS